MCSGFRFCCVFFLHSSSCFFFLHFSRIFLIFCVQLRPSIFERGCLLVGPPVLFFRIIKSHHTIPKEPSWQVTPLSRSIQRPIKLILPTQPELTKDHNQVLPATYQTYFTRSRESSHIIFQSYSFQIAMCMVSIASL